MESDFTWPKAETTMPQRSDSKNEENNTVGARNSNLKYQLQRHEATLKQNEEERYESSNKNFDNNNDIVENDPRTQQCGNFNNSQWNNYNNSPRNTTNANNNNNNNNTTNNNTTNANSHYTQD